MKKLVFLAIMMFSTTIFADNWDLVVETKDGYRIIANKDTYRFDKYDNDKYRAHVVMQIIGDNENSEPFITAIDVDDCVNNQAGALVNVFPDKSKKSYFWSVNGSKIYDAQGAWLCLVTIEMIRNVNEKKQKNKKYNYM